MKKIIGRLYAAKARTRSYLRSIDLFQVVTGFVFLAVYCMMLADGLELR